ncbi:MAG: iron-containing alcohol dehydrogenase [Rhizobiales bacterium]|nr:iron-containing alcohol dehydrogenase [Hyphomicrobiales bacterium]
MASYFNPVDVRFGGGTFSLLADLIGTRDYGLVTYRDAYFQELAARLQASAGPPVIVVDDVLPNPDVVQLASQVRRFGNLKDQPEVIVALGGGSVIDSAKVFAAARGDYRKVDDYLKGRTGSDTVDPLALIAVPTTAGTGSEVTCWGTVWDGATGKKYSLAHKRLYPEHAVVDPELMIGKPRALTIQTGLDALSHSLESLWNRNANPVSLAHAVAAARGVLATLPALIDDLANAELRARMAEAALLAGFAFSNTKTAIAHSLSYPITLRHGVPHGIACSFTLPMVIRSMAGADGLCGRGLAAIFETDAMTAADRLTELLERMGIATSHHSYGIDNAEWRELIDAAFDGERGQNFIGTRAAMMPHAGLAGKESAA